MKLINYWYKFVIDYTNKFLIYFIIYLMKTLNITEFIKMIKKNRKGYKIVIEDRIKLGYNTYGIVNQGEFINYMNPHDNCLWDAIIPGYNYQMSDNKVYY